MKLAGMCVLAAALLATACSRDKPVQTNVQVPKLAAKSSAPAKPKEPDLFDAQGHLKSSGRKLAWLEIPMGFEDSRLSRPQHHVFEGHGMTVTQTREYLAERMLTGSVQEMGENVLYKGVMSPASEPMRFDVMVRKLPQPKAVLLSLDELQFLGVKPLSLDEAKRVLAKEQKRVE